MIDHSDRKVETLKKILISQAIKKNPGQLLSFCGEEKSWDDCFTIEDIKNEPTLVFWYNLPTGHTLSEILPLN